MYIYIYVLADVNVFIVYMVLRCFVSVGSQAKKQARAAEAARREEERTAVKRAKEEATRATWQTFDVSILFDGLIFFQMIIDYTLVADI